LRGHLPEGLLNIQHTVHYISIAESTVFASSFLHELTRIFGTRRGEINAKTP
jgi:hypothetical protein